VANEDTETKAVAMVDGLVGISRVHAWLLLSFFQAQCERSEHDLTSCADGSSNSV